MYKKIKFYHTSGTRYKVGDVIGGNGKLVFLNTSPIVHHTMWDAVLTGFTSYAEYKEVSEKEWCEYTKIMVKWDKERIGEKPTQPVIKNKKISIYGYMR